MSREALHESLSAVMDNEADELELRRVLAAGDDGEMRSTWSRYQIARAAMHKELLEPRLDIAAAVSAALADEAVPVKPQGSPWRGLGRLAVAASVTVAVLAGVRLYNQSEVAGPQMAQQAAQPVLAVPRSGRGRRFWLATAKDRLRHRRRRQLRRLRWSAGTKSGCRPMCVNTHSRRHLVVVPRVHCRMRAPRVWKNVREKHARLTAVCDVRRLAIDAGLRC